MILRGKTHKFGPNVDTDVIIAARYLTCFDGQLLAKHLMEDIDPDFTRKIKPGDIMLATTNFGCGSSREHAPIAIKAAGISCVVAQSFARIFFRNSINIGLPLLECAQSDEIADGALLEIDLDSGEIKDVSRNKVYRAKPYPLFMQEIIKAGSLVAYTQQRLKG